MITDLMNVTAWVLGNIQLALFILSVVIIVIHYLAVKGRPSRASGFEIVYQWITLLPLGITLLYGFVMFVFYPELTNAALNYEKSPLFFSIGVANLAFGLIAILAYASNYGFRVANVIGSTCWLWGCWVNNVYEVSLGASMPALNLLSSWSVMSIIIPIILIVCIFQLKYRE